MMSDQYSQLGQNLKFAKNADQAELLAIERRSASIVSSLLDERISGELDDSAPDDKVIGTSVQEEDLAGRTLEHIQERERFLGDCYPFFVDGQTLRYKPGGNGVYEFCLRLSLMDHSANQNSDDVVLFELLSARAVALFLSGEYLRSGWPTHDVVERPKRLKAVSARLQKCTGEWHWSPIPPAEDDPSPRVTKDEGMDFVVWRRLDNRDASLFVAGQCACGNDWRNKLSELSSDRLARWWPRTTYVPFVRAFALPYVIPGNHAIQEVSRVAGLVFDRIRLTLASSNIGSGATWDTWFANSRDQIQRSQGSASEIADSVLSPTIPEGDSSPQP